MKNQILLAETWGMIEYAQGLKAPAQSKNIMKMIEGREVGKTPKGEASTIEILGSWSNGWNKAHRAYMKEKFGF